MGWQGMALSAVMSLASARQAQKAYANDAQAAMEQAEMAGIEADQEAINRTAQLREQLASISASSAGGGVSVGAGGSMANIKRRETRLAKSDVGAIKLMGASKQRQYKLSARASKTKGKAAIYSGVGKAMESGSEAYSAMPEKYKFLG
tara:strand:+ start:247 stop:690 length:444 start_codon:yes stop_codon:yes gene_type:complete